MLYIIYIVIAILILTYIIRYIYHNRLIKQYNNVSYTNNNNNNSQQQQRRIIVVTGCDGNGLGYNIVKHILLQSKEYNLYVIACCHTDKGCKQIEQLYSSMNIDYNIHKTIQLDLTNHESINNAILQIKQYICNDSIYALINNAGTNYGYLCEMNNIDTIYRYVMEVNYFGLIKFAHLLLPYIKQYNNKNDNNNDNIVNARIVNINSFYGILSTMCQSAYAASKHAMKAYNTSLRQELYSFNIDVIICYLGTMNTPLMKNTTKSMYDIWHSNDKITLKQQYSDLLFENGIIRSTWLMNILAAEPYNYAQKIVYNTILNQQPYTYYIYGYDCYLMYYLYPLVPEWLYDLAVRLFMFLPNTQPRSKRVV